MTSLENFVSKTLDLLEKERQTEIDETRLLTEKLPAKELQNRGVCLLKLRLAERRSGLYGRNISTFEPFWSGAELPSHNLTPGDIVGLNLSQGEGQADCLASGIVSKISSLQISVAFDETADIFSLDDDVQYKLTKLANDVTYKRLKGALKDLNKYTSGPAGNLINILFDVSSLSPPSQGFNIEFFNENLDESQREAVRFSLLQKELAVIHGPPGTGKTTTVIEVILQAVKQGLKVLACAPSNIAVDNLVERLSSYKKKIVRIGHPARLLPSIQPYALDAIVANSEETKIVEDVRKDLDKALSKMKTARNKGARQGLKEEVKLLRKELRQRAATATKEILTKADVVLVTLTSATDDGPLKFIDKGHFDLVVIDENSQALEAACWIALLRAPRCILAGDHHQLPPTILSKQAEKEGLGETLMERVLKTHRDEVVRMLTTQYRMNEAIMQWSSDQLYEGKLSAHDSVKFHLLKDLPHVNQSEETEIPLLLIDTAGCDLFELDLPEEISKGNEGEAGIVASHVEKLVGCGLKPDEIAVIAPYNLQVDILRGLLSSKYPKLEIKSVDGFQGREKEAVIITCVRSNSKGDVGFLAENRRMNVAVTRARRHLALICDTETVSHDKFLKTMVEYFNENGEVWSAHQYIEAGEIHQVTSHPKKQVQAGQEQKKTEKKNKDRKIPSKNTEEDDKKKEEEFRIKLEKFNSDKTRSVLSFPSNLNSHDRLLIHQISDALGLVHLSKGDGKDRYIEVKKENKNHNISTDKTETTKSTGINEETNSEISDQNEIPEMDERTEKGNNSTIVEDSSVKEEHSQNKVEISVRNKMEDEKVLDEKLTVKNNVSLRKPSDKITCLRCNKDVIPANIELHELHCYRQLKQQQTSQSASIKPAKKKEKNSNHKVLTKKENINLNRTSKALEKVDPNDLDALLETVSKLDKRCAFPKCKELTLTLGQTCDFCSSRFCFHHYIPEVHGCGDQARSAARKTLVREGVIYRGSGVPDRKPDPEKKAHLQKKLDKRLEDLSSKRLHKKSSNK
ncbi:DNA-binding protein SMUBP-2 [Patella vulgata]|uniref:DNA-binding protein SMUBP-2 n=1 Tax=Patella vulgata TaxID=6465 RepID=UPI00217FDB5D|nr:DNA-binding protein SMUBP-2 [Patella vulgata]